jgi:hypothetical protein
LSLYLSFFDVGPFSVVPLIDRIVVALSDERKTWPRKPSAASSQPNGKLCERRSKVKHVARDGSSLHGSTPGQVHTTSSRQGASRHRLPYEPATACSALYIDGILCATHLRERMSVFDVRTRGHDLCPLQRHAQPVVHGSMPSLLNQIDRDGL